MAIPIPQKFFNQNKISGKTYFLMVVSSVLIAVYMLFALHDWQNRSVDALGLDMMFLHVLTLALLVFAMFMTLTRYLNSYPPEFMSLDKAGRITLTAVSISFLIATLPVLFNADPYIMPAAMGALLVATLVNRRLGVLANMMVASLVFCASVIVNPNGFIMESAGGMFTDIVVGTLLIVGSETALTRFVYVKRGFFIGLVAAPIAFCVSYLQPGVLLEHAGFNALWALVSSVLAVVLFTTVLPLFELGFKAFTTFRLYEICSFNTPLLKRLRNEAPGTFNHSITVGSYAEQCAMAIGENPQLARAAGYYHDVGKLKNPEAFIENQRGYNPHDDLIPEVSVKMITEHTDYGAQLITKSGYLPLFLADVALEHHGTTPVAYFYNKAQKMVEGTLDESGFSYANPRPKTRIAAIIMIVDVVEAAVRSQGGAGSKTELKKFIMSLVDQKIKQGQFSDCPITFKDIESIADTLTDLLPASFHGRISYNNDGKK